MEPHHADAKLLIVLPTLGHSPYLDAAAASIRAVDLPRQVIVSCPVDQMDALRARFRDFAVVADAGREGGLYGAINAGLAAAKPGWKWFTYLNDDDLLTPEFNTTARRHCRPENAATVAYGDILLIDRQDRPLGHMTIEKNPARFGALLQGEISPLGQQGILFGEPVVRALVGYRTEYRLCGDLDFWARACAAGFPFQYYHATVGRFRLQPGQLSGDVSVTIREQNDITRQCFPDPVPPWRRKLARWRFRLGNVWRYVERWRAMGAWRKSNDMLALGGERTAPTR